tara:strand:+ start:13530 stop:13640 length:111 start_codon:yes stop_codon:yes gene_type:complete
MWLAFSGDDGVVSGQIAFFGVFADAWAWELKGVFGE